MGPVKQALADAHLKPSEIDEVVLVGGTTRTPLIRATVENYFGRKPHTELNPDEVVALGAAVQANILDRGVQNMLLLDVTPLSLGIETYGGAVAKVIPRNSTIPASAQEMYTTGVDSQTGIDIHVLQGERELAKDCRSLARFILKVPPSPAGLPRIEVKFLIDANGILQVAAKDLRNGEQHSIEVQPSYGLNDTEIERMLEESIEYAEQDFAHRIRIDPHSDAKSAGKSRRCIAPAGRARYDRQIRCRAERFRHRRRLQAHPQAHRRTEQRNRASCGTGHERRSINSTGRPQTGRSLSGAAITCLRSRRIQARTTRVQDRVGAQPAAPQLGKMLTLPSPVFEFCNARQPVTTAEHRF
jgi:hypothetical protein